MYLCPELINVIRDMKRISTLIFVAVLSILVVDVSAQSVTKKRVGAFIEDGNVVIEEATTTLVVNLMVECERVVVGPYARYAQKYLGVRAPLVDRTQYRIVAADVAVADNLNSVTSDVPAQSVVDDHLGGVDSFAKLLPDKIAMGEMTAEEAAEEAAERIFELRRTRLDLITGEFGEGVYGAGLESALREIDKLEHQLIELFFGKHYICQTKHSIKLPVEADNTAPIIARFSPEEGLLASDNLAGNIVMLNIAPSDMVYPASYVKGRVEYRYANNATVTVSVGQEALVSRVLPIYEFGATVMFLCPTK